MLEVGYGFGAVMVLGNGKLDFGIISGIGSWMGNLVGYGIGMRVEISVGWEKMVMAVVGKRYYHSPLV